MSLPTPYYQSDKATLYCGDCLAILPHLEGVDCVVTDPPYGVNLGKHGAANEKRPQFRAMAGYESYEDTPENFDDVVVPAIKKAIGICGRGLVFSAGSMLWNLPKPSCVGGVYLPAGNGRCAWGFQNLAHCAFYGQCPDLNLGAKHIVLRSTEASEENGHPCPKPIGWMKWAVGLASREEETILDPFTGSGTTGVAAVKLGRKFIGIEIEPKYCEIAKRRIIEAEGQFALFEPPAKNEQMELCGVNP